MAIRMKNQFRDRKKCSTLVLVDSLSSHIPTAAQKDSKIPKKMDKNNSQKKAKNRLDLLKFGTKEQIREKTFHGQHIYGCKH
jgi:hypothetical protein